MRRSEKPTLCWDSLYGVYRAQRHAARRSGGKDVVRLLRHFLPLSPAFPSFLFLLISQPAVFLPSPSGYSLWGINGADGRVGTGWKGGRAEPSSRLSGSLFLSFLPGRRHVRVGICCLLPHLPSYLLPFHSALAGRLAGADRSLPDAAWAGVEVLLSFAISTLPAFAFVPFGRTFSIYPPPTYLPPSP